METINVKYLINSNLQANEAYKALMKSIQVFGSNTKTIGFTSCSKENWKSLVVLHLASSLAEAGKKIILVAADNCSAIISDQSTHVLREINSSNFLSDSSEDKPIYHTDIDNLDLEISDIGYQNYSEKQDKENYVRFIKRSEETYDYILFDIPALDAPEYKAEMAKACDGMILVLKANTVDYKAGKKAKALLEKSECPILGAVLLQET